MLLQSIAQQQRHQRQQPPQSDNSATDNVSSDTTAAESSAYAPRQQQRLHAPRMPQRHPPRIHGQPGTHHVSQQPRGNGPAAAPNAHHGGQLPRQGVTRTATVPTARTAASSAVLAWGQKGGHQEGLAPWATGIPR